MQDLDDRYYPLALSSVESALRACYGDRPVSPQQLAATFRRGDLLEMLGSTSAISFRHAE